MCTLSPIIGAYTCCKTNLLEWVGVILNCSRHWLFVSCDGRALHAYYTSNKLSFYFNLCVVLKMVTIFMLIGLYLYYTLLNYCMHQSVVSNKLSCNESPMDTQINACYWCLSFLILVICGHRYWEWAATMYVHMIL